MELQNGKLSPHCVDNSLWHRTDNVLLHGTVFAANSLVTNSLMVPVTCALTAASQTQTIKKISLPERVVTEIPGAHADRTLGGISRPW